MLYNPGFKFKPCALLILLIAQFSAADVSTLRETRVTAPRSLKPKFEWVNRSQIPMAEEAEESLGMENFLSVSIKPKKKHKISLRFGAISDFPSKVKENGKAKHELADAHLRYVDSRYKGFLTDETDLIFTHKLYIPLRERSIQRTEITHYKNWALLSHRFTDRFSVIGNMVATGYAFRRPNYYDAENDKTKANALYDLFLSGQVLYEVNSEVFVAAEFGWSRREYLRYKKKVKREDILPIALTLTYLYSDDIEIVVGLTSESPTTELKFNRITPFPSDYTTVFLESSVAVF